MSTIVSNSPLSSDLRLNSYELFIGLRYTRSRQRTRFISFISPISIVGIALGMTALITVLSVFNGFQREMRTRMLARRVARADDRGGRQELADWQRVAAAAARIREVVAAAPYVAAQGLLTSGGKVRGASCAASRRSSRSASTISAST